MDNKPIEYCAEHIKTGKIYYILYEAKDCTNSRDGNVIVVYRNTEGKIFARDLEEFDKKFRRF